MELNQVYMLVYNAMEQSYRWSIQDNVRRVYSKMYIEGVILYLPLYRQHNQVPQSWMFSHT